MEIGKGELAGLKKTHKYSSALNEVSSKRKYRKRKCAGRRIFYKKGERLILNPPKNELESLGRSRPSWRGRPKKKRNVGLLD